MELKVTGKQIETPISSIGKAGEQIELVFRIPRVYEGKDLADGTVYLVMSKSGASQTHVLDKVVMDNEIQAAWYGSFTSAGTVTVALKISDMEAELWRSYSTSLTVDEGEISTPAVRMFSMLRIAVPEEEDPITVSERTIVVPAELQNIAVQNDENSETVNIVIPRYFDGHDLDEYTAILKTVSSGGRDDLNLTKLYSDDSDITFEWKLAPPQTSYSGELQLQIRFVGEDFKWETDSTSVNIITSIDDDPIVPTTPSIIESLIAQVSTYANSASASATAAAASAQEAQSAVAEVESVADTASAAATRAESAADRAEAVQTDGDAIIAAAQAQANAAANSATQASSDADRAEFAADRAEQIAGGDFATHAEVEAVQTIAENALNTATDKEPLPLTVQITGNDTNGYTADKTFEEIYAAYTEGREVVAYYSNRAYRRVAQTASRATFQWGSSEKVYTFLVASTYITHYAEEVVFKSGGTFTGALNAPTAAEGTNTTQVATTAFVQTAVKKGATVTMTHAKSGTVHALTGLSGRTGLVPVMFKATAAFAEGDTFTVDGTTYAAQTSDGNALESDYWVSGACVSAVIDTESATVNFKTGGGIKLPALTNPATAAQIFSGYQAINALGESMTGTAVPYLFNSASMTITTKQEGKTQTLTCTASGSEILLAVACHDKSGQNVAAVGTLLGVTEARIYSRSIYTKVTYSGQTISLNIDEEDTSYGDTWYIWVYSK